MTKQYPVTGLKQVIDNLTAIGGKLEKQAMRSGLTAAAAVVRDEARVRAPKKSGKMAKSIRSGSARKNEDGNYSITVSLKGNSHAFLGVFFEYGVSPHLISAKGEDITVGGVNLSARKATRKGRNEGLSSDVDSQAMKIGSNFVTGAVLHPGIAPRPFLRPALDTKASEAIEAMRDKIISVVESKTGFNLAASYSEAA